MEIQISKSNTAKRLILVVDGQGGRIGKLLVEQLKERLPEHYVLAIGTNSLATAAMLKGGADKAATGEQPVVYNAPRADLILGPIGIVMANALMGEITPSTAAAISSADAFKILIPMHRCNHLVVGFEEVVPLNRIISRAIDDVEIFLSNPTAFCDTI